MGLEGQQRREKREGARRTKRYKRVGGGGPSRKKKGLTQPFRGGLNGTISGDDGVIVDEFPVRGLEVDAESVVHPEFVN